MRKQEATETMDRQRETIGGDLHVWAAEESVS